MADTIRRIMVAMDEKQNTELFYFSGNQNCKTRVFDSVHFSHCTELLGYFITVLCFASPYLVLTIPEFVQFPLAHARLQKA